MKDCKTIVAALVVAVSPVFAGFANANVSYDDSVYAYGAYYQLKPDGGDSYDFYGGTIGYAHKFSDTFSIQGEFTYMNASTSESYHTYSNDSDFQENYYEYYDEDESFYTLELMCGLGKRQIISLGVEYMYLSEEYSYESDGSYTTKGTVWDTESMDVTYSTSESEHRIFAKARVGYPFEIFSRGNQSLKITPSLAFGAGVAIPGDSKVHSSEYGDDWETESSEGFSYKGDGRCSISYSYKQHSIVIEGGYHILGVVDNGNYYSTGFYGRAGYAFSW